MLVVIFLAILATPSKSFRPSLPSQNRASFSLNAKAKRWSPGDRDWSNKALEILRSNKDALEVPIEKELPLLQCADVSKADNFYSGTRRQVQKMRNDAEQSGDYDQLFEVDQTYFDLMNAGFDRRRFTEVQESFIEKASLVTKNNFEIGITKEQQFKELKEQKAREKGGILQSILPDSLSKYVRYVRSLEIKTKASDLTKNMLIAGFFSFVVFANSSARSSFMYFVIGKLCIISLLLSRNLPQKDFKAEIGGPKRKVATWSRNAFNTALGITLFISAMTIAAINTITSIVPFSVPNGVRIKLSFIASLLSTGYYTASYEVYEEKDKNGWRWAKAMEESLPETEQEKLRVSIFGEQKLTEKYDYEYNPTIDDFPPQQKYMDDGDLTPEEIEAIAAYEKFLVDRKAARRPPLINTPPTVFGAKKNLYKVDGKVPNWITTAYKKNVLARNKWSKVPQKFESLVKVEIPLTEGPLGFRDVVPQWIKDMIAPRGIWEDRLGVSRAAARAFGTYRRTMWKIDDKVKLLKSDV